jgi:hypothetical protein
VAAMPAGGHPSLNKTRKLVEQRARTLLGRLQEFGNGPVAQDVEGLRQSGETASLGEL